MHGAMNTSKAVVKNADMSESMQQRAVDCAKEAMDQYNIEKDIAAHVKKTFDREYGPTWHCIVGRNFGSYVTHEARHFIYFYMGQVAILLYKSGKAVIKNADMSVDMQKRSLDCARDAMSQFTVAKEIAAYIKKEFDSKYGPVWHCVVGHHFGRLDDYTTYFFHYSGLPSPIYFSF
ncbi:unnamed protein product [Taenia asiatica]|uniref:Dynein light chain n=1 Tax=Taenia asiatica TaxID=60517 RepID=A0A0R3WBE7_TAEAS|nr:unnamed protein product [Taenia asiatica]